ncbi:N-acetyltransferase [Enterococcus florum]|uniref:N-acetyltransferase n=1 Tax=Enterococcus florum TaxID=2480627 RepID=A0A4P5PET5_9ENTE|nr:GNAT family N-acetyltransferase [Enterococcus florum]GCF94162.1 N-acetyltransferase [Enterococcus florum]
MHYRHTTADDLESVLRLSTEAFFADPLYTIMKKFCKTEAAYQQFIQISQRAFIRSYLTTTPCLAALDQDKVIAFAILEKPDHQKTDFLAYLKNGGWKLLRFVGIPSLIGYMKLLDQIMEPLNQITVPNWYLAHLAVDPAYQGRAIGSNMLQECIIPLVKEQDGKLLTLGTQTELNQRFYQKNGFTSFDHRLLTWKEQELNTWSLRREV